MNSVIDWPIDDGFCAAAVEFRVKRFARGGRDERLSAIHARSPHAVNAAFFPHRVNALDTASKSYL